MMLWFVFALMTAAAIFAVLWPLSRGSRPPNDGSEAAVYKDQLAEIDRDVSAGLIEASEAQAARVEISRRKTLHNKILIVLLLRDSVPPR